jgi:glycosyltransferase involved in cell wall biosynthesis
MKILFDATAMALSGYHKGGAYRYGLELLRRLPGVLPPEWTLALYFNFTRRAHRAKMEETCRLAGVAERRVSHVPPQILRALRAPAEWTGGAHGLFHGPFDLVPPTRRAARVVTIHDLAFLRAPEGLPAAWIADRARTVPPSARRAHRVITVSEFSRRDIVERLGVAAERVAAIHHGIGPEFAPARDRAADLARLASRYGVRPGFLLYLGTLQPNKNIEGLCAAYQLLRAEGFPGQLVLAGAPGWLFDEMWARIAARGHDAGVLRTGFVDEEDIPRLYRSCEAFALVSFLEGFGIPVIEAMACGVPVVAADACSLPEVCGDAGLLVDPRDPAAIAAGLRRAAAPGAERERLISRGRAWAARFTWERSASAHARVYREAAEEAGAA